MRHPFDSFNDQEKDLAKKELGKIEPIVTTLALGEEGGEDDPILTTQALGEEGGDGPIFTTLALGEEGGDDPIATTLAIGEEGGDDPTVTTLALGEEGGDFGDENRVLIQIPNDLKARRELRLERVLDRVTAVFGEDAVSPRIQGRQEIIVTGPFTPRNAKRWRRFITRMTRILGADNVFEAQNDGGAIASHPFDLGDIVNPIENIGIGTPTDLPIVPLEEVDVLTIATDTQVLPGL